MPLVLYLESSDPATPAAEKRRIEVSQRLSIGRGPGNDLVLNDSKNHVSKNHCVINFDGRGYTVTDSSTNGTFLNSNSDRLPRDKAVPLPEGSVLLLGTFTLTVAAITPMHFAATGPSPPTQAAPHSAGAALDDDLFGDPLGHQDVLSGDAAANQGKHFAQESSAATNPAAFDIGLQPQQPSSALIPDDFDIFGDKPPEPQWSGSAHHDHAPSEQSHFLAPNVLREKIPDDWDMADLGVSIDPGLAKAPSVSAPMPVAPEVVTPPATIHRVVPQPAPAVTAPVTAPARPPVAAPLSMGTAAEDSAALAAFLAATGLANAPLTGAQKLRLMQETGQILVATVSGLLELLSARATMKEEFRIDRTRVGATQNNPLKFTTNITEAIRLLLVERPAGFLPAPQSVEEALADLKKHQVALIAGMQATLTTVVTRFDPKLLEKRLEQNSILENILPGARKARYWEVFKTSYKEIVNELQDDFHRDLGPKFAQAYLEQGERSMPPRKRDPR